MAGRGLENDPGHKRILNGVKIAGLATFAVFVSSCNMVEQIPPTQVPKETPRPSATSTEVPPKISIVVFGQTPTEVPLTSTATRTPFPPDVPKVATQTPLLTPRAPGTATPR